MNKSDYLKQLAISNGLCQQWTDEWDSNSSDDILILKFLRGIDFCVKHNYPSVGYIETHFDKELLHQYGIFVNEEVFTPDTQMWVFNGSCYGNVKVEFGQSRDIYIRHDSNIEIVADGRCSVFIQVYDSAKVKVSASNGAKVFVYQHGGDITTIGNVTIRDKRR